MRGKVLVDDFGRGDPALRLLRDGTADHVCDIAVPGPQDDFRFRSVMMPVDGALLIESDVGSYCNERTPRHIARGGMDHYMISMCLHGEITFAAGPRSVKLRPGDLCVQDMSQASRTTLVADAATGQMRVMTLVLPRPMLAPHLASPDGSTASLIPRDGIQGRLLASQYLALFGNDAGDGSNSSRFAATVLARVIADAVGSRRTAEAEIDRANRHLLLAAIKRAIDANLQDDVSVDRLCRQFQMSRATLYRLFEPEGGLWHYIQDQRLNRAFAALASPAAERKRMIELAIDFRFSSDNTFVRAFRRRFGLTQGEVRRMSETARKDPPAAGHRQRDSLISLRHF